MGETQAVLRRGLGREAWVVDDAKEESHSQRTHTAPVDRCRGGQAKMGMAVLLDNIRSAWNVGSILRSADGFGFSHAYLCGITPTADNEAVAKTSLGAENSVPWSYHKDGVKLVKELKTKGEKIYGLEEDARAIPLETGGLPSIVREQGSTLRILIVGNEVTGVDPELLDLCDQIFYIPMRGAKNSFNVAIAFSIAAYALREQRMELEKKSDSRG
jgi:tRNA G18 (ribose-2'-O)-methylase SpoU